jgi:hypothetical protein
MLGLKKKAKEKKTRHAHTRKEERRPVLKFSHLWMNSSLSWFT